MYHVWLGEDPEWALYRHRERLEYTDPPVAVPPRSLHIDILHGVSAALTALAIIAVIAADTAPVAPPNLAGHGTNRRADQVRARRHDHRPHAHYRCGHRHLAMPHHHPKEAQR